MNARLHASSAQRIQPANANTVAPGLNVESAHRSGKLDAALIALARTIARQAAADFLRDGAAHDLCIEQGIAA
jgi:hypothetical protein